MGNYANGYDPVVLYQLACKLRGVPAKEVTDIQYGGGDNNYDLYTDDGSIITSDPEISLVIFEDWHRVRVPAGMVG